MKILDIPKSGRSGDFVFYMRGRTLCRRRYVVPRNVRTPARRRTRGAFGAIAKAWSQRLREEQRQAWVVAGAKIKSHPRLWQSGPLTGEMHFQSINTARTRIGAAMLMWPPERVIFGPNPVEALAISYINGQARLRLRISGPVTEDIMLFAQAPCSAGRKKWRHGSYLGLLPAPLDGESDITDLYVEKYGEPAPGTKVFIRTHQQKDGWEGYDHDLSAVVPVPHRASRQRVLPGFLNCRASLLLPPIAWTTPATPVRYAMHTGSLPEQCRTTSQATPMQHPRRSGAEREAWAAERGMWTGALGEIWRKGRHRDLWRGS